ncbi:conserved phage C-terminal domain-containing protein [Neobacillus sp. GCM10023253]|uniref:conserved phage C-terminal domain-containing protein n=1 Tax=Neobacillus sp. GCM10023253 TaxID=3252644 RepID=UPI00361A88A0
MTKLLINEAPIMIIPSLAVKMGLNEAIVLQQIHYWIQSSSHVIEGRKWIFNTYKDWQKQMPFWSESTIKRIIRSLEEQGFLISANWNKLKLDKTKWYTIDYQRLEAMEDGPAITDTASPTTQGQADPFATSGQSSVQTDLSEMSDWTTEEFGLTQALPEITTETTTEKKPIVDIVDYLNAKTDANYKSGTKKTNQLIQTRLKEGFTVEDFKKVIDLKTAEWLDDPHMSTYLRPETLFGNKFESYLNQKPQANPLFEKRRGQTSFKQTLNEEDFDLDDEA